MGLNLFFPYFLATVKKVAMLTTYVFSKLCEPELVSLTSPRNLEKIIAESSDSLIPKNIFTIMSCSVEDRFILFMLCLGLPICE
jgi:hypothetical protein